MTSEREMKDGVESAAILPETLINVLERYKALKNLMIANTVDNIDLYSKFASVGTERIGHSVKRVLDMNQLPIDSYVISETLTRTFLPVLEKIKIDVVQSINAYEDVVSNLLNCISGEQKKRLEQLDFEVILKNVNPKSFELSDITEQAYNIIFGNEQSATVINKGFEEEELREALQEQQSNPKRFQERVAGWVEDKKAKYFLIVCLIMFVYNNMIMPYFQDNIGKPIVAWVISKVREYPQKDSEKIGDLDKDQEAIIIGNTNYYYKISYVNEFGEIKEGYVAKRNVILFESDEILQKDEVLEVKEHEKEKGTIQRTEILADELLHEKN